MTINPTYMSPEKTLGEHTDEELVSAIMLNVGAIIRAANLSADDRDRILNIFVDTFRELCRRLAISQTDVSRNASRLMTLMYGPEDKEPS